MKQPQGFIGQRTNLGISSLVKLLLAEIRRQFIKLVEQSELVFPLRSRLPAASPGRW